MLTESEKKILKAVKEAKKMLEDDTGSSGTGVAGGDAVIATNAIGNTPLENEDDVATLNTAQKETNTDQVGLARGKKVNETNNLKKSTKAIKIIPKSKKGDEPPKGYIDPKPQDPNWRVLVNKDAIKNPDDFVSKKRESEKPKK
jgi:hypothetical protein